MPLDTFSDINHQNMLNKRPGPVPPNAFIIFRRLHIRQIMKNHGSLLSPREASNVEANRWGKLSFLEKKVYAMDVKKHVGTSYNFQYLSSTVLKNENILDNVNVVVHDFYSNPPFYIGFSSCYTPDDEENLASDYLFGASNTPVTFDAISSAYAGVTCPNISDLISQEPETFVGTLPACNCRQGDVESEIDIEEITGCLDLESPSRRPPFKHWGYDEIIMDSINASRLENKHLGLFDIPCDTMGIETTTFGAAPVKDQQASAFTFDPEVRDPVSGFIFRESRKVSRSSRASKVVELKFCEGTLPACEYKFFEESEIYIDGFDHYLQSTSDAALFNQPTYAEGMDFMNGGLDFCPGDCTTCSSPIRSDRTYL